ncbi:hypothetical protein [uncultured Aquimonas sp.]|uniref:DUF7079 family protein n=1 Tax=uncultured Aquimonas sp. TaxID=385483 RepID=UPI00086A90C6|nr:hypothetical protein [uncultured Aquimonas sp.]ODU46327.1 MAG: hypothetical protein ABS96_10575 [Xanthomonadaceae bacterium SCN 69-123]
MDPAPSPNAIVWEVLAQCWVDTEYDADQMDAFAEKLRGTGLGVEEIERIVLDEVCGAFALDTIAVYLSFGMGLDPWFFPEDEARRKVAEWLARPRWTSWLNPFWWLGRWAARRHVREDWRALRARLVESAGP